MDVSGPVSLVRHSVDACRPQRHSPEGPTYGAARDGQGAKSAAPVNSRSSSLWFPGLAETECEQGAARLDADVLFAVHTVRHGSSGY